MVGLMSLWMPILVSAVVVFVASSIIHMFLKYHQADYGALPDENRARDAIRPLAIPPGDYVVPRATSMKEMGSPEYLAKLEQGPVVMMTVLPNRMHNMGKSLGLWFVYCIIVAGFAAFVAGRSLPVGAEYLSVFCIVSVVAFAGFGLALLQDSIWWSRQWGTTLRHLFDALVYSLLTAGVFGWLWPAIT